jgi:hypothetical protein
MQEITHQELKDAYRTGRWITAGAFYFESAARIRALLREHGYEPTRKAVRMERCPNADAGYSVALAEGYDLDDGASLGPVLVLGFAIMSELGALVEREDDPYCQQTIAQPAV